MFGDLEIIEYIKHHPTTPDELVRFEIMRQRFERRLKELDEDTTKYDLILDWMRRVVVNQAPELLDASFEIRGSEVILQ